MNRRLYTWETIQDWLSLDSLKKSATTRLAHITILLISHAYIKCFSLSPPSFFSVAFTTVLFCETGIGPTSKGFLRDWLYRSYKRLYYYIHRNAYTYYFIYYCVWYIALHIYNYIPLNTRSSTIFTFFSFSLETHSLSLSVSCSFSGLRNMQLTPTPPKTDLYSLFVLLFSIFRLFSIPTPLTLWWKSLETPSSIQMLLFSFFIIFVHQWSRLCLKKRLPSSLALAANPPQRRNVTTPRKIIYSRFFIQNFYFFFQRPVYIFFTVYKIRPFDRLISKLFSFLLSNAWSCSFVSAFPHF